MPRSIWGTNEGRYVLAAIPCELEGRKPRLTTRIEDLAAALRAHAAGMYCAEAAVELLIGHTVWLRRSDFVGEFIESGGCKGRSGGARLAATVLGQRGQIADGVPVDLGEALTGPDEVNVVLVARAVLHASGHREATIDLAAVRVG